MTEQTLFETLTVDALTDVLQEAGYRVTRSDQGDRVQLLSAAQGIGFAVRPGNARGEQAWMDLTLSCALRVEGSLPEGLVNTWNAGKRFGRLSLQADFLVLEMDVVVAGGVTERHLRAHLEIWDRLLQELVLFLRQYVAAHSGRLPDADQPAEAEVDTAEQ